MLKATKAALKTWVSTGISNPTATLADIRSKLAVVHMELVTCRRRKLTCRLKLHNGLPWRRNNLDEKAGKIG